MSEHHTAALDAATVRKLEAEAASLEAETRLKEADIRLREAEIRQKIAHAWSAELGAESMRVQTESTLRQEKVALAANHHHHEYHFVTDVDWDSVEPCLAQMAVWHRLDPECSFHIKLNSPGGNVLDGFHLYDELENYSLRGGGTHHVTVSVRAMAASMAGILLQAADKRIIGRKAYLMIHQVSGWSQGSLGDMKDRMKWLDMLSEMVADLFVERSGGKLDKEFFEKNWERKDWYINAEDSLRLGLVDEIG